MHLLLAPFLAGVVFVQTRQIAVVALVEGMVFDEWDFALAHFLKHQIERALRADQRRGVGGREVQALRLQFAAGLARFRHALVGQVDVLPTREQVLQVPVALAMTHKDKHAVGHYFPAPVAAVARILRAIRPALTKQTAMISSNTPDSVRPRAPSSGVMKRTR